MKFYDAVIALFTEASSNARPGVPACQALVDDAWQTIPLEWNNAKRLADLAGVPVRLVDGNGDPTRSYPELIQEHA